MDNEIGKLMSKLKRFELRDNTRLLITADQEAAFEERLQALEYIQ